MSIYHCLCKSNGRMNIVLDNFKHVYINKKVGLGRKTFTKTRHDKNKDDIPGFNQRTSNQEQ